MWECTPEASTTRSNLPSGSWFPPKSSTPTPFLLTAQRHLLALVRGFQPPSTWTAQLLLFPYPNSSDTPPPLQPVHGWNLLAAGLPPDNWESLAIGPRLRDGRTTLVLASDDNFNPLQSSWVAVMAPRRDQPCAD